MDETRIRKVFLVEDENGVEQSTMNNEILDYHSQLCNEDST